MEKRVLMAFLLAGVVMFLIPRLLPSLFPRPMSKRSEPGAAGRSVDSSIPSGRLGGDTSGAFTTGTGVQDAMQVAIPHGGGTPLVMPTDVATYTILPVSGDLRDAVLARYKRLPQRSENVRLGSDRAPLLAYSVLTRRGEVTLGAVQFSADTATAGRSIELRGVLDSAHLRITYMAEQPYLMRVQGRVDADRGVLSVRLLLPSTLESAEADTLDDLHHLAFVTKGERGDAESIPFSKLDSLTARTLAGPLDWVGIKNKYFMVVALSDSGEAFSSAAFVRVASIGKVVSQATGAVELPVRADGSFGFLLYVGPQEWRRLVALHRGLENANPYGGFLRPVVQPFATVVMQALLWMHDHLVGSYGWVLVIFGFAVRLLLWPLNQSAMRSSLKLQRIQPELQAIQRKYRSNPEKLQAEMMQLYRAHGMSPFSPVAGCLPMLIPMPVLFALFFVFQNTIEFRGVSFLWMADISQRDPLFILPLLMGVSMFVLSWIGLRSSPPNPQAKMMAYVFPVMMTVFFLNLAAGLNLYYAVQNVAALPQQWLIAKERARAAPISR